MFPNLKSSYFSGVKGKTHSKNLQPIIFKIQNLNSSLDFLVSVRICKYSFALRLKMKKTLRSFFFLSQNKTDHLRLYIYLTLLFMLELKFVWLRDEAHCIPIANKK